MALEKYNQKRNFKETGEPEGREVSEWNRRFVVQEHQASHHHFDLRLQMPDDLLENFEEPKGAIVLKSWAVPKEIPMEKGVKRLAVQVEDHPVAYFDFEGTIPEGQYGAGTVRVWDKGAYEILSHGSRSFKVRFAGRILEGDYAFVKTAGSGKNQWLLFRS